ncbi:proline-rich receptor-like protein kinase PERK8 [Iris pallida]|uniref:Proline-rich receptor-like protein kinase PERK8 n=1 Tax=Iris pallida TaxID=29817 RepID=A0AAX6EJ44_IRIPA|nr:proline-rich receptor-like protein kinase PERK8 [Iris pallida]
MCSPWSWPPTSGELRRSVPDGHRPPGRAVEAIRAFCTTSRRDAREITFILALRRSDFAHVFPEIRPLDRRFLRSVTISFRGANFISLYLLHRSSVWRATSSGAKLDSMASVGPPILISCSGYRGETLWLQWDLLYLSAVQVIEIAWRCLLA